MSLSESADERPRRVRRGAFPTPKSEIERAERFEPKSACAGDADDDATTPDTNDAGTSTSVPGPDDQT